MHLLLAAWCLSEKKGVSFAQIQGCTPGWSPFGRQLFFSYHLSFKLQNKIIYKKIKNKNRFLSVVLIFSFWDYSHPSHTNYLNLFF